ncbi:uncharacterized protein LOC129591321 [Paramacrobiotus metropolitanus]|uniref:uncharacterized protein LOC129591321 n=1 Tax=Paramacrobiotus metropolitanus TaxID=2943436 RepID=UPI0024460346|nr:uncharacterized protein LOC129591321 [Paramacrobiotus metropolitanus]
MDQQIRSSNKSHYDAFHLYLRQERFDLAIKEVAQIRKNPRLRHEAVRSFLTRASALFRRVRLDPAVGWLAGENADFADTVRTAVAVLGDDFYAVLVEHCVASGEEIDRSLVNLFLEFSQEGYLWTDVIRLCLSLADWELHQHHDSFPVNFDAVSEHLSSILQFLDAAPKKSMPNPIFRKPENTSSGTRISPAQFAWNKPEITAAEISCQLALSVVCANLLRQEAPVGRNIVVEELYDKALQMKMFREAVLLAKHCGVGESAAVFRSYANWIIQVSTLAREQWEEFFAQISVFINRLPLVPAEINWQKEVEDSAVFVERILSILQTSLVNLFKETGTITDLLTIVDAYHMASFPIFLQLDQLLVSVKYFRELLWHLLGQSFAHERIFHYVVDWIDAVNGEACIATRPTFSLQGDTRVEIPYIGSTLWNSIRNYFCSGDPTDNVTNMWETLEHKYNGRNLDSQIPNTHDQTVIIFRKRAAYPTSEDEESSSSENENDVEMLTGNE